jgi:hypothetical protein
VQCFAPVLLALAEQSYDALRDLNKLNNFMNTRKIFVELWQEFGRETLEKNLGPLPDNRRKKNTAQRKGVSITAQRSV